MSDSLPPVQGSDVELDETAGAEPGHFPGEADSEPDVLLGPADDTATDADEPPVNESTPFQTPTGQRVDPADD